MSPSRRQDPASIEGIALVVTAIGAFLPPFMTSSVNIALPAVEHDLGLSAVALGWVTSAFLLAAAVLLLPFGRLADIVGRKRLFLAGAIIFTLATVACAAAPSGAALIAARGVQGVGGALLFATTTAIVTSVFPPERQGRAIGLNLMAVYVGLSGGPLLGGWLTAWIGWRGLFLCGALVGLVGAGLTAWRLPGEWAGASGESFDLAGTTLYGLALVALMVGLTRPTAVAGLGLIAAGVLGLAGFALWEARAASPVLDVRLLSRNRPFALSNVTALFNYAATFAVPFLLSLYLQDVRGLGPVRAGLVIVVQPLLQALLSPLAGRLSDRVEPRLLVSAGMGLSTLGLLMLSSAAPATPLAFLLVALALVGLGFALFSSPNTHAVMAVVEPRLYGVASGTVGTMRVLGQMLGMAVVLVLFALAMGASAIRPGADPRFLAGTHHAFVVFAVLGCVGLVASTLRGRVHGMRHAGVRGARGNVDGSDGGIR